MMCNPIPMKYPFRSGLIEVAFDEGYRSMDDRLLALKDERSAQGARPDRSRRAESAVVRGRSTEA